MFGAHAQCQHEPIRIRVIVLNYSKHRRKCGFVKLYYFADIYCPAQWNTGSSRTLRHSGSGGTSRPNGLVPKEITADERDKQLWI